jgi:hypothetical protein
MSAPSSAPPPHPREHTLGARRPQSGQRAALALYGQWLRLLRHLGDQRFGLGRYLVRFGQLGQRVVDVWLAAHQIAIRDQLVLRMAGQPALAGAQQLVGLVLADPVVLGAVEGGEQDVELFQCVREPQRPREVQVDIARISPFGELRI